MKQAHINTVSIPIERLIPHPKNPNTHDDRQIKKLRHLIRVHGYSKGSVVYQVSTHYILAGHGIIEALKAEDYTHVDAVELDIDDSKAEAFMIADNKIATDSVIDNISLQNLINELSADNVPSLDFGFDSDDLAKLASDILADSGGYQTEPQDDEIPEVVEPITRTGDLWMLGKHRVYCNDSTVKENVERLLDGNKIDMLLCDPPYGMNLETEYDNVYTENHPTAKRKSKKSHHYKSVIGDNEKYDPSFILSSFDYVKEIFLFGGDYYMHELPENGGWLVWDKTGGHDSLLKVGLNSNFELCWSKQKHKRDIIRIMYKGVAGMRLEDGKRVHPTQKPVGLMAWFIDKYSESDNIILDLFLGSGSTLIACQKLNRVCFGMEIDQHYCDVIIKRYIDFVGSSEGVFCERQGQKIGYANLIA